MAGRPPEGQLPKVQEDPRNTQCRKGGSGHAHYVPPLTGDLLSLRDPDKQVVRAIRRTAASSHPDDV